ASRHRADGSLRGQRPSAGDDALLYEFGGAMGGVPGRGENGGGRFAIGGGYGELDPGADGDAAEQRALTVSFAFFAPIAPGGSQGTFETLDEIGGIHQW